MKLPVYNKEGKEVEKIELNDEVFALPWNDDLMYQVVFAMQTNARQSTAHTKGRGEVRGGGKKPWKQKGTGRARHGSSRSPIWVGGGIAHGPRTEKDYARKINKKTKAKALAVAISQKIKDNELILVEELSMKEPKTKVAKEIIKAIAKNEGFEKLVTKRKNTAFVAMSKKDKNLEKSFTNFSNMTIDEVRNLNILDVLNNKYLILENASESIKELTKRFNVTKK